MTDYESASSENNEKSKTPAEIFNELMQDPKGFRNFIEQLESSVTLVDFVLIGLKEDLISKKDADEAILSALRILSDLGITKKGEEL